MLRQRAFDPRHKVAAIRLIVGMLQLTAPAFGEVPARRLLVMRAVSKRAVVEHGVAGNPERHMAPAFRDAIPTSGDADDWLVHRASSSARGMAAARSSAII